MAASTVTNAFILQNLSIFNGTRNGVHVNSRNTNIYNTCTLGGGGRSNSVEIELERFVRLGSCSIVSGIDGSCAGDFSPKSLLPSTETFLRFPCKGVVTFHIINQIN